ncbi:MAG TPA: transcription antitermination factor NusB [Acidimicrobiales bacterium]|jgi:N utilization substance protein B
MSELGQQRHRARERALEILYEATIKVRPVLEIVSALPLAPDPYTISIVTSAERHQARAEALISEFSEQWSLERMAIVDRIIMIMAIGELLLDDPPPRAVVMDEAVELAKVFSTDGSASFVNGVLSACVDHLT